MKLMLYRFPPPPREADSTYIKSEFEILGKLKIESKAGKRRVFMTRHTLIFVMSGKKVLHTSEKTIEVSSNSVFLLRKGIYVMAEYLEQGENFEAVMLFLSDEALMSFQSPILVKKRLDFESSACLVFPCLQPIQDFIHQFHNYFKYPDLVTQDIIQLKQKEILLLLTLVGYGNEVSCFIRDAISRDSQNFDYIIRQHILQPISVSELAHLTNRSLSSFKTEFRKRFGLPPRRWLNMQRLTQAKVLLQNTNASVKLIAEDCGFESTSYFIRAFKARFGVTPANSKTKSETI